MSLANDKVEVIDLDSTNGTQLEGNRLLPGIPAVEASQALRIGDHWLKLELTPESAPVAEGRCACYDNTKPRRRGSSTGSQRSADHLGGPTCSPSSPARRRLRASLTSKPGRSF